MRVIVHEEKRRPLLASRRHLFPSPRSDQSYRSMTVSCTCLVCLRLTGVRLARPAFSSVFSRGRPWTS